MKTIADFRTHPGQLYFTVPDHVRSAKKNNIESLAPDSDGARAVVRRAEQSLKQLLNLSEEYAVLFFPSSEVLVDHLVGELIDSELLHLRTDDIEHPFERAASLHGKEVHIRRLKELSVDQLSVVPTVSFVQNDASEGRVLPADFLESLRRKFPDALIVGDYDSAIPYYPENFQPVDIACFSVQFGLGLPSNLAVMIINRKAREFWASNDRGGHSVNHPHSSQPSDMLAIYLLDKICNDLLTRGLRIIRQETNYKAAILYNCIANHPGLRLITSDRVLQSKTTIACQVLGAGIEEGLLRRGLQPELRTLDNRRVLIFANYPTHSKEQYELLVDTLDSIR